MKDKEGCEAIPDVYALQYEEQQYLTNKKVIDEYFDNINQDTDIEEVLLRIESCQSNKILQLCIQQSNKALQFIRELVVAQVTSEYIKLYYTVSAQYIGKSFACKQVEIYLLNLLKQKKFDALQNISDIIADFSYDISILVFDYISRDNITFTLFLFQYFNIQLSQEVLTYLGSSQIQDIIIEDDTLSLIFCKVMNRMLISKMTLNCNIALFVKLLSNGVYYPTMKTLQKVVIYSDQQNVYLILQDKLVNIIQKVIMQEASIQISFLQLLVTIQNIYDVEFGIFIKENTIVLTFIQNLLTKEYQSKYAVNFLKTLFKQYIFVKQFIFDHDFKTSINVALDNEWIKQESVQQFYQ